jgi:hypothetical protein
MKSQSQLQLIAVLVMVAISSVFLAHPTKAQVLETGAPQTVIECLVQLS